MKRRIMALLLAATLVFQGVSTVPVFANEAVEIPGETTALTETAEGVSVTFEAGSNQWFNFTATETTEYTFYTTIEESSNTNTNATLYDAEGNQIAQNEDASWDNYNFKIATWLEEGQTYYLEVGNFDKAAGAATLFVETAKIAAKPETQKLYVPIGEDVVMNVIACSAEGQLAYAWEKFDPSSPTYYVSIDGSANSLTVPCTADMSTVYRCNVTDGIEGNSVQVIFNIYPMKILDDLVVNGWSEGYEFTSNGTVYYSFTATEARTYSFYTDTDLSVNAEFFDADMNSLGRAENTDTGFYFEKALAVGEEYYLAVTVYKAGTISVYADDNKFTAAAEEDVVTINYGEEESDTLDVIVNNEYDDVEPTFEWYHMDVNNEYKLVSNENDATLDVYGTDAYAGQYKCIVTCGELEKTVYFIVKVDTGLEATSDEQVIYASNGESITLTVNATSAKQDSIKYEWSYMVPDTFETVYPCDDASYTFTKTEKTPKCIDCTVSDGLKDAFVSFTILNLDGEYVFGNDVILPQSLLEDVDGAYMYEFVPEATGTYTFVSEGNSHPEMTLTDGDEFTVEHSFIDEDWYEDYENENPNRNFTLTAELEKGKTYYMTFRMNDADEDGAVVKASVSGVDLMDCKIEVEKVVYNGEQQRPGVTVKLGDYVFENEVDYSVVEYYHMAYNNKLQNYAPVYGEPATIGTGYVIITPTGNGVFAEGDAEAEYTVEKASLADATVVLEDVAYTYDGTAKTPEVESVKIGNLELTADDYTVSYDKNTNAGTAKVIITAKEDSEYYKDSIVKEFNIAKLSLAGAKVTASDCTYTGSKVMPAKVTVELNGKTLAPTDYTVVCDSVNAGKATVKVIGKGNYTKEASGEFTINAASIDKAVVTIDPTSFTYDGTAKVPKVTVTLNGKVLTAGADYDVTGLTNNAKVDTYTVTVTAKGNYTGVKTATYTINAASVANATVTVKDVQYEGKTVKPAVTVKIGGVTLKEGTDYTVTYSNNSKIGTAKVTITGIGNYAGTKTANFKVKKGAKVTVGSYTYEITGNDTVAFAGIVKSKVKKTTTVKTGDTVKINGKKFKVTSIANKALYKNTKVKTVKIGKNVTTIGTSAFEGCTKLSSVTIGAKVTKIGDKAFKKCTALKKITIPAKVTTIGKEAFSGAKNLKTITVKSTKIKTVGKNAFKSINKKATIKVPSKKVSAYKKTFKNGGQAKTVEIKK